jgi:hypothetical protein
MRYVENSLRLLEPEKDLDLYRQAFEWRKPKKHLSPPRIDWEDFTANSPTNLTIGLFNGELQALYFFQEYYPRHFEAHFTTRKGVSRETVLQGGKQVLDLILSNGGEQVDALVLTINRPLRCFVTQLGFTQVGHCEFSTCEDLLKGSSIQARNQRREQMFVRYAKRA